MRAAIAAAAVFLLVQGCATVMSRGPRNGMTADAQALAAQGVEKGLEPFRGLVAGRDVSVKVAGERGEGRRDALRDYVGEYLREMAVSAGGRYVGEEGGDVRLEVLSANVGLSATQRNFVVPVGQNVRVPLFYSEGLGGGADLLVVARDGAGNVIPRAAARGAAGETEYYIFRVVGPFRR